MQNSVYIKAINTLEISLYYDDFSTDPPTRKIAVEGSEGPFAFPTIEPGVEDYEGVATLVKYTTMVQLLSPKAIAAMLMVDFWYALHRSPIYGYRS